MGLRLSRLSSWKIRLEKNIKNAKAEDELLSLSADLKAKFLHVTEMILAFGPQNVGRRKRHPRVN